MGKRRYTDFNGTVGEKMKRWKYLIPTLTISIALGVIAFIALLWIERQALMEFEQTIVVRCKQACPAGEEITEANVQQYFEEYSIVTLLATKDTYRSLEDLLGTYPNRTIESGEIVYRSVFSTEDVSEELEQPIELSITSDIDFAVAGRIRKGDVVNVYVENENSKVYELVMERVIVQEAYDSNATVISMGNEHALASMFTFCVEASVAENLNRLYSGKVVILKVKK